MLQANKKRKRRYKRCLFIKNTKDKSRNQNNKIKKKKEIVNHYKKKVLNTNLLTQVRSIKVLNSIFSNWGVKLAKLEENITKMNFLIKKIKDCLLPIHAIRALL